MKFIKFAQAVVAGVTVCLTAAVYAQAPSGSTGECKDGSYSNSASKRGACKGHGGVKDWYSAKTDKSAPAAAAQPTSAPAPGSTSSEKASTKASSGTPMPTTAAAGGGNGKVWVNTSSNVYHCEGAKWYGTTKKGEYMSEADAKAKGAHADHGKACSK